VDHHEESTISALSQGHLSSEVPRTPKVEGVEGKESAEVARNHKVEGIKGSPEVARSRRVEGNKESWADIAKTKK